MATSMTFIKDSEDETGLVRGRLTLSSKSYAAVSGPWKNGALPDGKYTVKTRNVVDSGLKASYKAGGSEFFIPIEPNFDTTRTGLGIHPDGGEHTGTLGCIGIVGQDASAFWNAWTAMSLSNRPDSLSVQSA